MNDQLILFLSSGMDELSKERKEAEMAMKKYPIIKPWVFEFTPATVNPVDDVFIDAVKRCDIFVLVLGEKLGQHTKEEFLVAKEYNKNILILKKDVSSRSSEMNEFLNILEEKERRDIRSYSTPADFINCLERAVLHELVEGYRRSTRLSIELNDQLAHIPAARRLVGLQLSAKCPHVSRSAVKSPLELLKESPAEDDVLPMMAELPNLENIPQQISYVREASYAEKYSNSWAEQEAQLIGCIILSELEPYIDTFLNLYDVGCANCGQYESFSILHALKDSRISPQFSYYAQDFNPDWNVKFQEKNIENAQFFEIPLPMIPVEGDTNLTGRINLICCVHVFHYLHHYPLAIYTSLQSFNRLLEIDGYCYITVPEKAMQPGMLNLLEKAALDASFTIMKSGKRKLIHDLQPKPYNMTTFYYLILQKNGSIRENYWRKLVGISMDRASCAVDQNNYAYSPVDQYLTALEKDIKDILYERDERLATIRYLFDAIKDSPHIRYTRETCNKKIIESIHTIDNLLSLAMVEDIEKELENNCAHYLKLLVAYYYCKYAPIDDGTSGELSLHRLVYEIFPNIRRILNESGNIRVDKNRLEDDHIAHLMKHLFELCHERNIDIDNILRKQHQN